MPAAAKGKRRTKVKRPSGRLKRLKQPSIDVSVDRLVTLARSVSEVASRERTSLRTARLLKQGVPKMAQKVIEEAAEVGIEAVRGDKPALISESADLFYNLVVLWTAAGVRPDDVWREMDRREKRLGMAEKIPKPPGYYAELEAANRND